MQQVSRNSELFSSHSKVVYASLSFIPHPTQSNDSCRAFLCCVSRALDRNHIRFPGISSLTRDDALDTDEKT